MSTPANSGFSAFVPPNVNDVIAKPDLDIPSSEVKEAFDARSFIAKQTGIAPSYSPSSYTSWTDDIFTLPWVDTANVTHTILDLGYPEQPLQARYQWNSAYQAACAPTCRGIGWVLTGGNVGKMRIYAPSEVYSAGTAQAADLKLKSNQVTNGGWKVQDQMFTGNAFFTGTGDSAKPAPGSASDSLHRVGIRLGGYCVHKAWLQDPNMLPMGGVLTAADPGIFSMTGKFVDNTWGAAGGQLWGNEGCTIFGRAVYPLGANYPAAPVCINNNGTLQPTVVTQPATGRFCVLSTRSTTPPNAISSVLPIPPNLHPIFQGRPGALLAAMMLLIGPGPVAIMLLAATVTNKVNATVLNSFAVNAARCFTNGPSEMVLIVPSDAQAQYPTNAQNAYCSTYYDYTSGPNADGCVPANCTVPISYTANDQNAVSWISMAGFIRTWYQYLSVFELCVVAEYICTFRMADLDAGVFFSLAQSCMYPCLQSVSAMGAAQDANDYGLGSITDNPLNHDSTRTRDLVNNINGLVYPISEVPSSDYAIPDFDLVWLASVLIGALKPDRMDSSTAYFNLLLKAELLQATFYICRCIGAGHQLNYDRADKPSSFWNQLVLPQGVSANYPVTNQVQAFLQWREDTRLNFVSSSSDQGMQSLAIAAAAPEIVRMISGATGLCIPRDSWGFTMFHYRTYPSYSVPCNNGTGGYENVLPFTGGMVHSAQWIDCQAYKPGVLLDYELYSVLVKPFKRYMQPPMPYTPLNFGINSGEQMLVQGVNKTLPVSNHQLYAMVSAGDLFNDDTFYYNLKTLFSAGYTPSWLSNTQAPLVLPRDNTLYGNVWQGGITRKYADPSYWTIGFALTIQSVFLRMNHLPCVDIAGTRGYAWFFGGAAVDMSGWLSQKTVIYSNVLLFNKVAQVISNTLGKGLSRPKLLESGAAIEIKQEEKAAAKEEAAPTAVVSATATLTL
jgi:hypothetical protein